MRPGPSFQPELRQKVRDGSLTLSVRPARALKAISYGAELWEPVVQDEKVVILRRRGGLEKRFTVRFPRGDYLFREPLARGEDGMAYYKDDGAPTGKPYPWESKGIPSIFMPSDFSRAIIRILDWSVIRLHSITEEEAKASGVNPIYASGADDAYEMELAVFDEATPYRNGFAYAWDRQIKLPGAWKFANPWVLKYNLEYLPKP
jgi:hypothetical protein